MGTAKLPNHLLKQQIIGRGSYGEVYKGRDMRTGKDVAIKIVNLEGDDADIDEIRREVSVLCQCDSPYIIKYHESHLVGSKLCIVMDHCALGSLRQILETIGPLQESILPFIAKEVLKALAYLHDNRIIHRDVKAANLLVTDDGHLKLGDFGVAVPMINRARRGTLAGSFLWMAPEILLGNASYDAKADIWSFGIAMYELLTGLPPYKDVPPSKLAEIFSKPAFRIELPPGFTKLTNEFISQCLQVEPEKRPSAKELLKTRYFRGVKTRVAKSPLLEMTAVLKKTNGTDGSTIVSPTGSLASINGHAQPNWDFESQT